MFVINWALVTEGIVFGGPLIVIQLKNLSHNRYVAKSQAFSTIVNGAAWMMKTLEADLAGVPPGSGTEAGVINGAVETLRTVYAESIEKLGGSVVMTDDVLRMILQQVRLPNGVQSVVNGFFGSATVPGGMQTAAVFPRRKSNIYASVKKIL